MWHYLLVVIQCYLLVLMLWHWLLILLQSANARSFLYFLATGAHPVEGGVFPKPPAAAHLLTMLPPPNCFVGPFVKIDDFLSNFRSMSLPDGKWQYHMYLLFIIWPVKGLCMHFSFCNRMRNPQQPYLLSSVIRKYFVASVKSLPFYIYSIILYTLYIVSYCTLYI